MAIFNSYVSLPEGKPTNHWGSDGIGPRHRSGLRDSQHGQLTCDGSSGQMSHADHIFDLLRFGFP